MENVQMMATILQLFLSCANVILIVYAFIKFLNKPHDTLQEKHEELKKRVDAHDVKIEDIEDALHHGNDRFREQEETNATFKSVMLSFVNFEIAYCLHTNYEHTEDLMRAKTELENYLSGKKRHETN